VTPADGSGVHETVTAPTDATARTADGTGNELVDGAEDAPVPRLFVAATVQE
jgi:hypothetical protein